MQSFFSRWMPVVLWCALIFFLSSQPILPGPEDVNLDFLVKKLGHITVYGILFFFVHRALGRQSTHRTAQSVVLCVLYAISDEYHQSFVPGRTPMLRDIGFDITGMFLSWVFLRLSVRGEKGSKKQMVDF